jgi:hypothetical protein
MQTREDGIEMPDIVQKHLESIYTNIKNVLDEAHNKAIRSINFAMVQAYWQIGRLIVEEEQSGKERADYGRYLIRELSKKLSSDFGKGFDERNLWYMRSFYTTFPNVNALRSELTWTHYRILLRIENHDARNFYLIESINSNWSTRELERQINSLLYERIALSGDKQQVKELSTKGHQIQRSDDLIKDPYVLEFLGIEENKAYQEKDLEKALIIELVASMV